MIRKLFLLFLSLSFAVVHAQTPAWAWARGIGGDGGQPYSSDYSTYGWGITTDYNGNVYSVGSFKKPTLTVGPFTLNNANNSGRYDDPFIVKYDPLGNVIWAISGKGDSTDIANNITIDRVGNLYVTGDFASPNLVLGSYTLSNNSPGATDVFLIKVSPAGNILWAKSYGGPKDENGVGLAVDSANSIYLTGNFISNSFNIGSYTLNIDSVGAQDMYIAKFDSSGSVYFARPIGVGCTIPVISSDIVCDKSNNVYLTGKFNRSHITLGTYTLSCNSPSTNFFVAKYDPMGNVAWAYAPRGANYNVALNSLVLDKDGNIYGTGNFSGYSLIIGNDTLISDCCLSQFLIKLTSAGDPVWAVNSQVNNPQSWPCSSIGVDSQYGIYINGGFTNQVNGLPPLVFGTDTLINGNSGHDAIFIAKYDSSGLPLWGKTANSVKWNMYTCLTIDRYDNIYGAGIYCSDQLVFGNDTLTNVNPSPDKFDFFLTKIGTAGVGIKGVMSRNDCFIYPNPGSGAIHLQCETPIEHYEIRDVLGKKIFEDQPNYINAICEITNPGIYFVTVRSGKKITTKKLIIN